MDIQFPYNYICVEGNIGAGKTTFCQLIKEEYSCRMILEQFDDNPFLPFFYENPERYAFTVELFFMTERYKQLQSTSNTQDLFRTFTIADYTFIKTLLFAKNNLPAEEFKMFQQMFAALNKSTLKPDLIVYFHRSVDILQQNIKKRGRTYENKISDDYLLEIQNAYFEYFRHILSFPILIIDLKDIDFVSNRDQYNELKLLLSKKYRPGVHRYTLMV